MPSGRRINALFTIAYVLSGQIMLRICLPETMGVVATEEDHKRMKTTKNKLQQHNNKSRLVGWPTGRLAGWLLAAGCCLRGCVAAWLAGWLGGKSEPRGGVKEGWGGGGRNNRFVSQNINNKIRATENHMNRLINSHMYPLI